MKIEITEETAEALLILHERYFFDLFKPIRESRVGFDNEEIEYQLRDAIAELAQGIKENQLSTGGKRKNMNSR